MKYLQNLHTHTTYCDGRNTAEEMVQKALSLGFTSIGFSGHSYMSFSPTYSMSVDGTEDYNRISAKDLGNIMERLLKEDLVSEKASRTMKQIMAAQQAGKFDQSLPVLKHGDPSLPLPPVPEGRCIVINKGGTLKGKALHDAAIILLPNGKRVVITLVTSTPDNVKTLEIFKRLSRTLYDNLI